MAKRHLVIRTHHFFCLALLLLSHNDGRILKTGCVAETEKMDRLSEASLSNGTRVKSQNNFTINVNVTSKYTSMKDCNYTIMCNGTSKNISSECSCEEPKVHVSKKDIVHLGMQVTLYAIVFLVGVTGNMLVLLTVTSKRMRSVRNLLIGNLAIADLITLLVCTPLTVAAFFMSWPFGAFICSYMYPMADVVVSVSIVTLCVITMDRFRAIVYPFAQKMTLKVTIIVIVLIWLFSYLVVALPLVQLMKIVPQKGGRLVCLPAWPNKFYEKFYRTVILTVLYIIPVILVFFCFICIVRRIRKNMRFTQKTVRDSRSLARVQRRSRVVRMMYVIFITFAVCLLPIHLLLTLMVYYPPIRAWSLLGTFYHAALIIMVANSAMNPIILYLLSSEFKRGFKEHCLCYVIASEVSKWKSSRRSTRKMSFENQPMTTCLNLAHNNHEVVDTKKSDENKVGLLLNGNHKQKGAETVF